MLFFSTLLSYTYPALILSGNLIKQWYIRLLSTMISNNMCKKAAPAGSVWSAALFISGASLGAGLLALPIETGLAGLVPALAGLFFIWALMLVTGGILAESFVDMDQPSSGLFSLYVHGLGRWSSWLVTPSYFLVFYGVLVAYLSGSGSVLAQLLHRPHLEVLFLLLFFTFSSWVVLVGMRFINRANAVFMFLLISSFAGLLVVAGSHMDGNNLGFQDWSFLPSALPIVICAFAYQNVIPSICISLENDRKRIRRAIFYGTGITLLVNGLWILVVLGVLPVAGDPNSLLDAFHKNQPATIPLDQNIHSNMIDFFGMVFSMAALFTSYVAVGEGLRNFLADLLGPTHNKNRKKVLVAALTFLPPLLIALVYPRIFLKVLNLVGGTGVVLLFGLLPAIMLFRQAKGKKCTVKKGIALLLCAFCIILLGIEFGQESGLLKITPQTEYWPGH
jgi:tyrosine-specific transport protein